MSDQTSSDQNQGQKQMQAEQPKPASPPKKPVVSGGDADLGIMAEDPKYGRKPEKFRSGW